MSPILEEYLTRKELAAELGVCSQTIIRWAQAGEGPPITRVGQRPLYRRPAVVAWLAAREAS